MPPSANPIEAGSQDWAADLVRTGFLPFLLTFMFQPLPGAAASKLRQMFAAIEQVYARHLTRVLRKPNAPSSRGRRPIWLCCPDRPVFKHAKVELRDVTINDGLHLHALAFTPSASRLRQDLAAHFLTHRDVYQPPGSPLRCIHVEPITHDLSDVVAYARKSLARGRFESDSILILPRTRDEMRERAADGTPSSSPIPLIGFSTKQHREPTVRMTACLRPMPFEPGTSSPPSLLSAIDRFPDS